MKLDLSETIFQTLTNQKKIYFKQSYGFLPLIFLFILSPYFYLNGIFIHGGLIGIILIFLKTKGLFNLVLRNYYLLCLLVLFASLLVLYFLSALIGESQTQDLLIFLGLILKVISYVLCGILFGLFLQKSDQELDISLKIYVNCVILAGLTNAFIVLAIFFNPELKLLIEKFLAQGVSNINYFENHRPRGLASAGGASLSVFHVIATFCLLWMFICGRVRGLIFLIGILPLAFSG